MSTPRVRRSGQMHRHELVDVYDAADSFEQLDEFLLARGTSVERT